MYVLVCVRWASRHYRREEECEGEHEGEEEARLLVRAEGEDQEGEEGRSR